MSEENRFQKIAGKVEDIARDLMSLEVNTIIRDQISGSKMPGPYRALIDISEDFRNKLEEYGYSMTARDFVAVRQHTDEMASMGVRSEEELNGVLNGDLHGYAGFALIRERASAATEGLGPGVSTLVDADSSKSNEERLMLRRISDMSAALEGILHQNRACFSRADANAMETGSDAVPIQELQLNTRQTTLLRKIWEVRTETIAIQTVISLDGDVINRIIPAVINDQARQSVLYELHDRGVNTSLRMWKDLVDLVKSFFGAFVKS